MRGRSMGPMLGAALLAAGAAAVSASACSSFSGAQDPTPPGPLDGSTTEASVVDAPDGPDGQPGPPTDAGAADAAGLLQNTGFEGVGPSCLPGWATRTGLASNVDAAHSGSSACLLCSDPSSYARLFRLPDITNPAEGVYQLQAFMREGFGPSDPERAGTVSLIATVADGGILSNVGGGPLLAGFAQRQVTLVVPAGATNLAVQIEVYGGANGGCGIVDDVSLTLSPP